MQNDQDDDFFKLFDEPVFKELEPERKVDSRIVDAIELSNRQRKVTTTNLNQLVPGKSDKVIADLDKRVKAGTLTEKLFCEKTIEVGQLRQVSYQETLAKILRTISHIRTVAKGLGQSD